MHLFELTQIERAKYGGSVPDWALGCFRRRSITYYVGQLDETTRVLWLQSRGLTADFRLPPAVPRVAREELGTLDLTALIQLCRVEGGFSRTRWDGELMHWSDWVSFQTHAKWPEPGHLRRVGDCLIEFAPSGAYVEDWRLQPSDPGPLIGLSLIEERDLERQTLRHLGGGLIVCGEHAAFVRGRPRALPEGRLVEYAGKIASNAAELAAVFGFDASYARAADDAAGFRVTLSTLPWRLEQPLLELEGFSYDPARDLVLQRTVEDGISIERLFRIDTLEPTFVATAATVANADARSWFDRERDELLVP